MEEAIYLVLILYGASTVLEALIYIIPPLWRIGRLPIASSCLALSAFICGALLGYSTNPLLILVGILSAYRVFNLLRIVNGRLQVERLRRIAGRTYLTLTLSQISLLFLWSLLPAADIKITSAIYWLTAAQILTAFGLLYATIKNLRTSRPPKMSLNLSDHDAPTLTVCIPARNETTDLSSILETLLKSDYPKLEVVVYDDCSQEVTAQVVRDFAHRGIRFIGAKTLMPNWLAKNQAYDRLTREASGDLILFCGVDARFEPHSLRRLVSAYAAHDAKMLSILPKRTDTHPAGMIIQSIRYWWELALPRWLLNQPPVLSTCWLVEKKAISKFGGFAAVAKSVRAENYFARKLHDTGHYNFYRSANWLGISSVKSRSSQLQTALRTRYPQLRQRIETVALLSLAEAVLLVAPLGVIIAGFFINLGSSWIFAWISLFILTVAQCLILAAANRATWWQGFITYPLVVCTDIFLAHYSMIKYEFSSVIWKGRNICLPVLRAIPDLPAEVSADSKKSL